MLVSEEQTLIEFFWHPLAFHLLCCQGPGTWPTYLAKVLEKGAKSQSAGGEKPASDILPGSSWFVCSDWWVLVSFPWLLTIPTAYVSTVLAEFVAILSGFYIQKKLLDWLGKSLHAGHWGSESRRVRTWPFCVDLGSISKYWYLPCRFFKCSRNLIKMRQIYPIFVTWKMKGASEPHVSHFVAPVLLPCGARTWRVSRHQVFFILCKWHLRLSYDYRLWKLNIITFNICICQSVYCFYIGFFWGVSPCRTTRGPWGLGRRSLWDVTNWYKLAQKSQKHLIWIWPRILKTSRVMHELQKSKFMIYILHFWTRCFAYMMSICWTTRKNWEQTFSRLKES